MPTFMIVPSLACQASCKYCFGPHEGRTMDRATAEETVRFVHAAAKECGLKEIQVIFHGGEPLLAPHEIWEVLLAGLSDTPDGVPVRFSVQSNLWRLDDRFIDLFKKYRVSVGTSLDGPEALCDMNRGEGYYKKTISAIDRAEQAGLKIGAIVTLTKQTLPHAQEILTFFRDRGIAPVLHACVKGLGAEEDPYALTPEEYAEGVIGMYPWYVKNRKYFSVPTLDRYCTAAVRGETGVCSMQDCLGMFLAVSPTGDITGCQRMSGRREHILGNIFDRPDVKALLSSPPAERLAARERLVGERCRECRFLPICRGGCYYNALSAGDGVIDPLCEAYKRIYTFLEQRIAEEVGSEENLRAMARRPARKKENPIARSGPYISLSGQMHPAEIAENARVILGAYALGRFPDIQAAAEYMVNARIAADVPNTAAVLSSMKRQFDHSRDHFNNCYIHTTFRCNLRCTHCYAAAGESDKEMPLEALRKLSEEALGLKFRQLVFTGGEPLFHRERDGLLALCRSLRGRGSTVVLRTNLTGRFSDALLKEIALSFDQIAVSTDGNEQTHDARRGKGSYQNAVSNLERYAALTADMPAAADLSLAAVLTAGETNGEPGRSVRALGDRLGFRTKFRPMLPLGRAADSEEPPFCECIDQHEAIEDILRTPFHPKNTCGIGQNVYICPDGESYPCYAWQTPASYLGNVLRDGLGNVLSGERFTRLKRCTVDTMQKCRTCPLRYLCGSACRAWGNREETDPDTAPAQCDHLVRRANELLRAARAYLELPEEESAL